MNFESEIALLQASFYCTENGLTEGHAQKDEKCNSEAEKRQQAQRQQERVSAAAVSHAVREIVHGLERERTQDEKRHWNFKLHAILFYKLLERRKSEKDNASDEEQFWSEDCNNCFFEYFEGVSRAIPNNVDLTLYLGVASTFGWGPFCAQVLHAMEYTTAAEILEEIAAACIEKDSLEFLVSILISSLVPSSHENGQLSIGKRPKIDDKDPHRPTQLNPLDTSERAAIDHRHVTLSCELICKFKNKILSRSLRFCVIRALVESLSNMIFEFQLKNGNHGVKFHSDTSNPINSVSTVTQKVSDPNICLYKLHLLSLANSGNVTHILDQCDTVSLASQRSHDRDDVQSLDKLKLFCAIVAKVVHTLHCLLTVDWSDFFVDQCDAKFADLEDPNSTPGKKEAKEAIHLAFDVFQVLNRVMRSFGEVLQKPVGEQTLIDNELLKRQCSDVQAWLSQVLDEDLLLAEECTVAMEMDEVANEERGQMWLLEAIRRVDERLEGYEVSSEDFFCRDLKQLLSASDQWEEELWIECLERNISALAVPRFMEQLIGVAIAMDERNIDGEVIQRVLKVLLASFSALPFPLQNKLRDWLLSHPTGVSLFTRHDEGEFDSESTSAFNRLVSLAQGQENTEVLTAVSRLAMQCPVRTLRLAVSRAVSNAAVCQAVCQVLQAMPSLATFRRPDDEWPLLCHLIQDAMATLTTTPNEEANLLQLVTTLLQPFKPLLDPHCPFWMPPVLPVQAFAQVCVLPNLRSDTALTVNQGNLVLVLMFLKEIVSLLETSSRTSDTGSVFGTAMFPIMLCLCQLLDSCRVLWGGVAAAMVPKVEVKEAVQGLLRRMGRIAMTIPGEAERDSGISWLINRVMATLHWSTALALQETLQDSVQHQKKLVPASLISLCTLPGSEWCAAPTSKNTKNTSLCDQMIELFLCCRVSDNLANFMSKSILLPEGTSNHSFLEALTLALVQVLPQSIMGEWQCIMGMLAQLMTSVALWVPCSARYVVELPMVNIGDFRVHLGQSQLLLTVMQLLLSPCCQDWATLPLLHHVTRCYVSTMQQLLSQILTSDLSGQPGCFFVIGQFFCHACDVISSLPTDELKEQVFVLTLEFLSQMDEIACSEFPNMELGFEWTNQIEVLELLTNQGLDGDQRRTLLQKIGNLTQ